MVAERGVADRQAGAGAGRREELAGGDARRRPRAGGAGDHGLRLRRRRPALPGRLGLRRRRRRERGARRCAQALVAAAAELRRRRPAPTRRPTSARWSRRRRASGSPRRSAGPRPTAPSCCSTAAATPARPGRCSARRIAVAADHESELAREELFGPLLTAGRGAPTSTPRSSSSTAPATATPARSSPAPARPPASYRYGAEAGMLGVNVGVPAPVAWFPFSGWKDSIDGDLHANGTDAVELLHAARRSSTSALVGGARSPVVGWGCPPGASICSGQRDIALPGLRPRPSQTPRCGAHPHPTPPARAAGQRDELAADVEADQLGDPGERRGELGRGAAFALGLLLAHDPGADRARRRASGRARAGRAAARGRRSAGGSARRGGRGRARRGCGRPCARGRRRCRCSRRRRRRGRRRSGRTTGRWVGETSIGPPQAWVMRRPSRPGK